MFAYEITRAWDDNDDDNDEDDNNIFCLGDMGGGEKDFSPYLTNSLYSNLQIEQFIFKRV